MLKKNILLTGATGTVGKYALQYLTEKSENYNVTVFAQNTSTDKRKLAEYSKKAEIVYGDLRSKSDVYKINKKFDAVIHLAAVIPPLADENKELSYGVNVVGTNNLVEFLKKNSPDAFFIYTSSVSVYGDRLKNNNISTDDILSPSPLDYYATTKIEAEELIQNSGLNYTIMRLSAVAGDSSQKPNPLLFHMPLDTNIEFITAEDAANACVSAIEKKDELLNKIYNLGGGENCRILYKDFIAKSFDIFGLGKVKFPKTAFAEKNFHCGLYADGDKLNSILNFRRYSLDEYFNNLKNKTGKFKRLFLKIFAKIIEKYLVNQSEPMKALNQKNKTMINHFFTQ